MPKMFIHAVQGTFEADARAQIAAELTDLGIRCEALSDTSFVRNSVWVFFNDYPPQTIFTGGKEAAAKVMSLVVYTLEGGLSDPAKRELIAEATQILGRHARIDGRIPVHIVLRTVAENDWGMFGETGDLDSMRSAPERPIEV